jgi:hypothetical protein
VQADISCEEVWLGCVRSGSFRFVMRMIKGPWAMASTTSHLTTLSIRHIGSTNCRKLKSMRL